MSFSITLQNNASPANSLAKSLTTISSITGTLRQDTSIINPVFRIEGSMSSLRNCNYCTITEFNRSYFVNNITSLRDGIIELSCHVDVLTSFATAIKANRAITRRQKESWNLYLNDGVIRALQPSKIQLLKFPNALDSFNYILTVAGN